jgi:hypothetical protein
MEEAVNFLGATVLERLRRRYSIDVMHVEKNVCESLLRTLLNTDGKTRDHGHA